MWKMVRDYYTGDYDVDEDMTEVTERPMEEKLDELKEQCQTIFTEDPSQIMSDASLCRFLRAWYEVEPALAAIVKYLEWRRAFDVDALTGDDADIQAEQATDKAAILHDRCAKGRPVIYVCTRKHNSYERNNETLTKFIIYLLETACRMCDEDIIDNLCIVFDLKNFAMANMDYQGVKTLIWLLGRFYPERLGVCLIINAPMIFYGCWAVIRPWMHDVTVSKVKFIDNEVQLAEYIDPSLLPT